MEIAKDRFSGFSGLYDSVRPRPPKKICPMILGIINRQSADTVVDLGCGTGLSTEIWGGFAKRLIGIEPNDDMIASARAKKGCAEFINSSSYETGLPEGTADIVCCSQSFHWMEPVSTLKEVNRILKDDGLFAVWDCTWPVAVSVNSEIAYEALFDAVDELADKYADTLPVSRQWPKNQHLKNIADSGFFRYLREILFENTEECDADRFIGIALSQGHIQSLMKNGIKEIEKPIENFRTAVKNDIDGTRNMTVSYRMVIGFK